MSRRISIALAALVWLLLCSFAGAQESGRDVSTVSLEALTQMQLSVSSFSCKNDGLWKVPAAVYVIGNEQIADSAASSIRQFGFGTDSNSLLLPYVPRSLFLKASVSF